MTATSRPRTTLSLALLATLCGAPSSALLAAEAKGFLYGTVSTRSGATYEGRLRWGKEEAFWTDHFNASKESRPLAREIPKRHRDGEQTLRVLGRSFGMRWNEEAGRQLIVRFGDLRSILPHGSDEATLVLKSGGKLEIGGGSNDVDGRVTVWDRSLGEVQVDWDKIRRVDFKPAPADLPGLPARLFGTVRTTSETLRGFVQWDKEECLSTDLLDGETEDGKLAVEMGKVRSIERRGKGSSTVTLKDARELVLRGTNDVDDDNRGIFVDDPRFGRVLVPWRAFDRVDFEEAGSGPGYDDFPVLGPLEGAVTTRAGAVHKGRIVFDVDESEGWESLDGESARLEYSIPFFMVASVSPAGTTRARVTLKGDGRELTLEDSTDVTDANAGVFVLEGADKKTYVPWQDVKRIDFAK